jgi:adenylate kinase family enzyme
VSAQLRRVVVLGRGGAGKSTLARRLGADLDLPVVELDQHFWRPDLTPTPPAEWARRHRELIARPRWIVDGDLGRYDLLPERLRVADTVLLLDFPLCRCAWRALRRSRENREFWCWLIGYRRRDRPVVLAAVAEHAPDARLRVLRSPRAVRRFLADLTR